MSSASATTASSTTSDSGDASTSDAGSTSATDGTMTASATATTTATTTASTSTGETTTASSTTASTDSDSGGETDTDTGGPICQPPDVLVVLDRTLTMHRTPAGDTPIDGPDYASSKWHQAITALEGLVAPPFDSSVRFGLELWPRDPGGGACVTLAERVTNAKQATNPQCEDAEIAVDVGLDAGQSILDLLDPATTTLCGSTPTGAALYYAGDYLDSIKEPDREQYVLLVTDGADWDITCPDPAPLKAVQDLEKKGIRTFVVGFDGGESQQDAIGYLNSLACAGQTAKGFPGPCYQVADGWTAVAADQAFPVFLQAEDGPSLSVALQSVLDDVCCGCAKGCDAPEVLFTVDRTLTMHKTPDGETPVDGPAYMSSKWYQAITAIEEVATTPGLDTKLRLGLELWPRDPGGDQCVTLAERVTNSKSATNPQCEFGELLIAPSPGVGGMIADVLDPATTKICRSTPTGNGLITAFDWFVDHIVPGRDQYAVLVTDGADWDITCPDPSPLAIVQQLAAAGIKTYVVGFFGMEAEMQGAAFLNDLACAGQTAKGFPAPCQDTANGWQAKDPEDITPLYLQAGNGELTEKLDAVAAEILAMCVPG
ncbi:MAG: vWA domain-containing protein [Nannocystaceae bacterium]